MCKVSQQCRPNAKKLCFFSDEDETLEVSLDLDLTNVSVAKRC